MIIRVYRIDVSNFCENWICLFPACLTRTNAESLMEKKNKALLLQNYYLELPLIY